MASTALITIGRLARRVGLSRTALLHYEAAGLLVPAGRNAAGYRLYGEGEIERLRVVRVYRDAGLSVAAIGELLSRRASEPAALLQRRLLELDRQARHLREQQRLLARLLAEPAALAASGVRSKLAWVQLLRSAGLSDEDMRRWHAEFEADAPLEHRRFLESLGIAGRDVRAIRAAARALPDA